MTPFPLPGLFEALAAGALALAWTLYRRERRDRELRRRLEPR